MTDQTQAAQASRFLDRSIDLNRVSWSAVALIAIIAMATFLRFSQLDVYPLSPAEAEISHEAYRFISGETIGPDNEISTTGPAIRITQTITFFLFGTSDVSARALAALLGVGIVLMAGMLRPVVGTPRAIGMAVFAAWSPILVYGSRVATGEITVAFFTMLLVLALFRAPIAGTTASSHRWAVTAGIALAAGIASGPSFLSCLIALAAGFGLMILAAGTGASGSAMMGPKAIVSDPLALRGFIIGFVVTLIMLFTHLFTDFVALAGIVTTVGDWGDLLLTAPSVTPTQFFLLSILLYELLAIILAIRAAIRADVQERGTMPWSFLAGWFVAALLLFSFSSGGAPEHAVHIALPLALLGGGELGALLASYSRDDLLRGRAGMRVLGLLGAIIAVFAAFVLFGRISTAADSGGAVVAFVAAIVVGLAPMLYLVWNLNATDRRDGRPDRTGAALLLAVAIVLGALTIRTTVMLSFFNPAEGSELLAQGTSTVGVDAVVKRVENLSRDTTVSDGSARDPEGGHGLSIAIDEEAEWPFRWYFRDFPDAQVVTAGQAPFANARVVIAPIDAGMAENGYAPQVFYTVNRVPNAYLAPSFGNIIGHIFDRDQRRAGIDFLLFRTIELAESESISLGLTGDLANRVQPVTGPFGLFERVGPGNGQGQFSEPRGIAASPDGRFIYVMDMGNARLQRFSGDGAFVGIWGNNEGGSLQLSITDSGLGPTCVTVSDTGQIFACDTWNHRVVQLDENGSTIREFGTFGDTADNPDPMVQPGELFGPRSVVVLNDELFVVDTGNERVQVFALDGTFLRAFGGHGTGDGALIEPVGIAAGPDGRLYVADSGNGRIAIYEPSGAYVAAWEVQAWAGWTYFEPYLTFDLSGNLYATSSLTGSVEVFSSDGTLIDSITMVGTQQLERPIGIGTASDGSILIGDASVAAVYRYTPVYEPAPEEPAPASPEADGIASPDSAASPATSQEVDEAVTESASSPVASPEQADPATSSAASPERENGSADASTSAVVTAEASPSANAALCAESASPVASPVGSPAASPIASPEASPIPAC